MSQSIREMPQKAANVGERLRRLRKQRRLTQSDLARQIGIQQSDLSRMEKGEYRVSLDNLFKILQVFDVAVAEFFTDAPAPAQRSAQALSQQDMQLLQMLRQLSPEGRQEAFEYIEFKMRREATDRRANDVRQRSGRSS